MFYVPSDKSKSAGFEVCIYESMIDKIMKMPPEERAQNMMSMYAGKTSIADFVSKYDLIIQVANVSGMMQPVERITWKMSKGTPGIPWYVHEVPTIFISVNSPFVLADAPQVKTYINTYDNLEHTMIALVEKLIGKSEFKGVSPVDASGGMMDTRI